MEVVKQRSISVRDRDLWADTHLDVPDVEGGGGEDGGEDLVPVADDLDDVPAVAEGVGGLLGVVDLLAGFLRLRGELEDLGPPDRVVHLGGVRFPD